MDSKRTRILCANCNICVNTLRRYRIFDQNTRVCTLFCIWNYPQIITDDDYVCEACWELSMAAVNQNFLQNTDSEALAKTSQRGHTNVCILCGCSLLRRQSDKIFKDNPTEIQLQIIEIVKRRKEPQQITYSDKLCHACWLRAKRQAQRINRIESIQQGDDTTLHSNLPHDPSDAEQISLPEPERSLEDSQSRGDPYEKDIARPSGTQNTNSGTLILPDYRRAANTGNHCLFLNCSNIGTLHSISDKLRSIILTKHKYYVPKLARVCEIHLLRNSWDILYESDNSINVFNAQHVQHIFSFVNAFNPTLDFENFDFG